MAPNAPIEPLFGAVSLCRFFLRERAGEGDRVVDATCGNGHDTLFLARLVGPAGRVWGFDLQEEALARTAELLAAEGVAERVELVHAGHERIAEFVAGPLAAAVFNLGYLPGGDKGFVTRPASTIPALAASLDLLRPGGILAVVVYTGHPGGAEEEEAVIAWTRSIDPKMGTAWLCRQGNRSPAAPYLVLVEKGAVPDSV